MLMGQPFQALALQKPMHSRPQKEKTGRPGQLALLRAMVSDQEGHKYDPMFRGYLPLSSGKQLRHGTHPGNKIAPSF